jgi:D-apionolactonase
MTDTPPIFPTLPLQEPPPAEVEIRLMTPAHEQRIPPISMGFPMGGELGMGLPSVCIEPKRTAASEAAERAVYEALREAGCRYVHTRFDTQAEHHTGHLELYKRLAERAISGIVLELIVHKEPTETVAEAVNRLFEMMDAADCFPRLSAVVPIFGKHLGASQTRDYCGGGEPTALIAALPSLYTAVRAALDKRGRKKVKVIGGTASSFTELNRRRPPTGSIDGVTHSFTAIVHDSSDDAVLSTLQVVPTIAQNVKALFPNRDYWLGPSTIGFRGNPFGTPDAQRATGTRRTMTNADPRQRGCFGAAYTLGLVSRLAGRGLTCIGLGDVIGTRG